MRSLQRALLDGALVVLPIGAVVLLVLGIVRKLEQPDDPLTGHAVHPLVAAAAALVVACLVVGLLVRSAIGRWTRRRLEARSCSRSRPATAWSRRSRATGRGYRRAADAPGLGGDRGRPVPGPGDGRARRRPPAGLRAKLAGTDERASTSSRPTA
ncbi:MAG: hypothetical protein U1E17_09540 [Geminicoccaceae bacterium]